jgi:predicted nuclease of restriction endonuclease-like RecB superfamily
VLTGRLVRVRQARNRIVPHFIDTTDPVWIETAERLLTIYRGDGTPRTRGELEQELKDTIGDDPTQLVHLGLAKLLEDRCEFEVDSAHPPEKVREVVFRLAASQRLHLENLHAVFDRGAVLQQAAGELGVTLETIERALFADLQSEQRLAHFEDITVERLLQRYNVSLAQAVLLRATRVHITIRNESAARWRQLLRLVKFHRLICELTPLGPDVWKLHLDGPLSLFSATQKYGLQLAIFLPAVLLCRDFELEADLLWGPQRKPKQLLLTQSDGLVSHYADRGTYVPPELAMFVELFRKRIEEWDIVEETEIYPLGKGFWVPDFQLIHKDSQAVIRLEVLGFWRKASAEKHLALLRQHVREPFLLAVSDQLHIEDAELEGLPAGIVRFRNMPLPDEVARLAAEMLAGEKR